MVNKTVLIKKAKGKTFTLLKFKVLFEIFVIHNCKKKGKDGTSERTMDNFVEENNT